MIVFYDATGTPVPLDDYEDFSVTHKLDGCDEMTFSLDVHHELYPLLYEEARVVANGNEWLIKKIDDDKIDCELNFDSLKGTIYSSYRSETRSLQEVLKSHLPEGWTVLGAGVSSIRRTIEFDFCTDYDVIYQCMNTYDVYFMWDFIQKRLTVVSQTAMQSTGEYLTNELNLKSLSFKGETTDFATRLYAYGKEGMTLEEAVVDGKRYGLQYVENKSYVDKVVCAYWSDERYTIPENLYEDAKEKLATLSYPVRSYECSVNDLAKQSDEYSFLDFKMHKKVTLIDVDRGIRVEHQIVEYKEYPDEQDRNIVTLSCVPDTISTSIKNAVSSFEETTEKMQTDYDTRIAMATAMLTGAFCGYVFSNGSEIFLMDAEDPAQAQVVWRWNVNGFGKSSTGIDGPYTTALTFDDEFITNVINAIVIRGSLIEADSIQASSLSTEYKNSVIETIENKSASIQQEFKVADEQMFSSITELLNEYSTTSEMNSAITQTASEINLEVSKKVNASEFGTKITQNASSVRIAWNSISNYIQFEDASLNIYDYSGKKLMSLNSNGHKYYYKDKLVGIIGTNHWSENNNIRSLGFNLETDGNYMTWATRDNSTDDAYTTKWTYTKTALGSYEAGRLHAGCDIDLNKYSIYDAILSNWGFDGGSISDTFSGYYLTQINSDGSFSYRSFSLTFKNGILQKAAW